MYKPSLFFFDRNILFLCEVTHNLFGEPSVMDINMIYCFSFFNLHTEKFTLVWCTAPWVLIPTVNLKSKRASNLASKTGLFRDSREPQFGTSKAQQNRRQLLKQGRGPLFYREKGGSWEGLLWRESLLQESESSGWWWVFIGGAAEQVRKPSLPLLVQWSTLGLQGSPSCPGLWLTVLPLGPVAEVHW